jgi:hypothetical protein
MKKCENYISQFVKEYGVYDNSSFHSGGNEWITACSFFENVCYNLECLSVCHPVKKISKNPSSAEVTKTYQNPSVGR